MPLEEGVGKVLLGCSKVEWGEPGSGDVHVQGVCVCETGQFEQNGNLGELLLVCTSMPGLMLVDLREGTWFSEKNRNLRAG